MAGIIHELPEDLTAGVSSYDLTEGSLSRKNEYLELWPKNQIGTRGLGTHWIYPVIALSEASAKVSVAE